MKKINPVVLPELIEAENRYQRARKRYGKAKTQAQIEAAYDELTAAQANLFTAQQAAAKQ